MFNENKDRLVVFMASMAMLGILFGYIGARNYFAGVDNKLAVKEEAVQEIPVAPKFEIEKDLVEAKSIYIYDLALKKEVYARNAEDQLPLASLSKIMSAIVARENTSGDPEIAIKATLLPERGGGDVRAGEKWLFSDLLDFTLLVSSNDGASALASAVGSFITKNKNISDEELFINKMNEKAKELELSQTYFINESGLDLNGRVSGSYGSAKDISSLLSYAYLNHNDILEATSYTSLNLVSIDNILHNAQNSNEALPELSGLSASKTGFTDIAGGNLAFVFEAGPMKPFVVVILGSSKDGRFSDAVKIHERVLGYLSGK